jgi:hypothetical protein
VNVSEEYAPGLWRPAVPLPFLGFLHVSCFDCGRRFWFTRGMKPARYERHYRAQHIPAGKETSR